MLVPVVLSGGSGTRLWPLSRELYPKQFFPLVGEQTLLQETLLRLNGLEKLTDFEIQNPIIVCNEAHRFLVAEQLRAVNLTPQSIILEPIGRNTAPALTLAALNITQKQDDAIMLVMPADHAIINTSAYHQAIHTGVHWANENNLITFGIVPSHAETGFGYLKGGESKSKDIPGNTLLSFVEKPDKQTAEQYLASGDYYWNSGMFMMKASTWLGLMAHYQTNMLQACQQAMANSTDDMDFTRPEEQAFTSCPSDSIDYAIMEKVTKNEHYPVTIIPLDAQWSDVGAWPALWDIKDKDGSGNVIQGDVLTHETHNSMLLSSSRLVSVVGVDDIVVIETADAVLVTNKHAAQDVKHITNQLKTTNREESNIHRCVHRPWGTFECIDVGNQYKVKRITVNPGASLSLQMHHHRAEHWVVVKGTAKVVNGEKEILLKQNQSTYIPVGEKHRLSNPGDTLLEIIEVQSGDYLGEDDIVRFEDNYGR